MLLKTRSFGAVIADRKDAYDGMQEHYLGLVTGIALKY
jgi:hypothetical protein